MINRLNNSDNKYLVYGLQLPSISVVPSEWVHQCLLDRNADYIMAYDKIRPTMITENQLLLSN